MLTIELTGYRDVEGTLWLLNFFPSDAGELPGGGFDVDAWDDAKTFISAVPGADVRAAFRTAYRMARIEARKHGGLEFMQTIFDDEPCPLPDLKPNALAAPAVIVDDGGPSYRSSMNHADYNWAKGYMQGGEFKCSQPHG